MKFIERAVRHQVMLSEDDVLAERTLENDVAVVRRIVFGKGARPTRLQVVGRVLLYLRQRKDPRSCSTEHLFVHVGGINARTPEEPFFLKKDGHRVRLLACRAAYVPNTQERECPQCRQNLDAQDAIKARITEHRGHIDRNGQEETLHAGRLTQQLTLEFGDALQSFCTDMVPYAATN